MNKYTQKIKQWVAAAGLFLLRVGESLQLIERVYEKPWPGDTAKGGYTMIALTIGDYGGYYRVLQQYFLKGALQREYSWLARFDPKTGNRLREIGGTRSILFDTANRSVYFESVSATGEAIVEVYKASQIRQS
ncbi:hypothetical protein MTO98_09690 [Mucilaginibacter sp. SMC90]|uniref:hypothetical protein n=1 Tax=Mucilaginibacter sp. SMC90 TaxID=2929803 RepID=UPI001FB1A787|nr:hypothetical protein [Mucilaginibacter sp. SMC90]UOE51349.1 hypothetical protein MTO98_09690 [Mucilaginibacter sp. SMC90]